MQNVGFECLFNTYNKSHTSLVNPWWYYVSKCAPPQKKKTSTRIDGMENDKNMAAVLFYKMDSNSVQKKHDGDYASPYICFTLLLANLPTKDRL